MSFRLTLLEDFTTWADIFYFTTNSGNTIGNRIPNCQIKGGNIVRVNTHIGNGEGLLFEKRLAVGTNVYIKIEQKTVGSEIYLIGYWNNVEIARVLHSGYAVMTTPVTLKFSNTHLKLIISDFEYN